MIQIPILAGARILGWPKNQEPRRIDIAQYYPLDAALTTPFECDAHFAQYSHPEIDRRLDNGVLDQSLFAVSMRFFIVDVDNPEAHAGGHEAPQAWRDQERAKVELLFLLQPGGFYYETKKGYRLLYLCERRISNEIEKEAWKLWYLKNLAQLGDKYEIFGDASCSDWTRLFRTPKATRAENTTPENRPTLGDPANVGAWVTDEFTDEEALALCDKHNPTRDKLSWWWRIQRDFVPVPSAPSHPSLKLVPSTGATSSEEWKINPEHPKPPPERPQPQSGGTVISLYRSYGVPALSAETELLAKASAGDRTKILSGVSLRLFALAKAGCLGREEVEQRIWESCQRNQYLRDYPQQDLQRQLQNWWSMATPRNVEHVGKTKDDKEIDPDVIFHRLTDTGNAERLVKRHGENLRYLTEGGVWYIWDGVRWAQDRLAEVSRLAKETILAIPQEAEKASKEEIQKKILAWAHKSEGVDKRRAMISLAASDGEGLQILPEQIDANPWQVTCLSGAIELDSGLCREHRREDLHTKVILTDYNPEATCPTWMMFLHRVMGGKPQLVSFLQRALGYSLTGDTREHCLFFLHGSGNNGKSTFLETIRYLFGDYACKAEFATFLSKQNEGPRNDLARLRGSRLVAASEAEGGKRLAEALIKEITGGDTISARFLHHEFFEFKPQFKIWLAANDKPIIKGTDHGIWRRIRLIPFTVKIPDEEIDKGLPEKLKAELPGILAWIVQGCLDWQKMGLGEPKEVKEATQEYREEMDMLADFITQKCLVGPAHEIPARKLYREYKSWAIEQGSEVLTETAFGRSLSGRGITAKRSSAGNLRCGITLHDYPNQGGLGV